jgi:hypothetical protein
MGPMSSYGARKLTRTPRVIKKKKKKKKQYLVECVISKSIDLLVFNVFPYQQELEKKISQGYDFSR